MSERNCLITGASSGIGRATALRAAQAGYNLAVVSLAEHLSDCEATAQAVRAHGVKALVIAADVASPADVEHMFRQADASLGPLHALVNNAGVYRESRVEDYQWDDLSIMLAVNFAATVWCCREATRRMSTRRGGPGGAIVNVSSMAATIGGRPGASAYAGSKAAVDAFTTGFAREVAAEGIRVNTVRPGVTATNMTRHLENNPDLRARVAASIPSGRIGQPEEVAELIVWLLSQQASLVTGAHINVGGGGFNVIGVN
jgi:NAD(P)-dependent dehydrogenase (short-subunit alcohol dehydrogenase family)